MASSGAGGISTDLGDMSHAAAIGGAVNWAPVTIGSSISAKNNNYLLYGILACSIILMLHYVRKK